MRPGQPTSQVPRPPSPATSYVSCAHPPKVAAPRKPAHGTPALPLLHVGVWTLAAGGDEAIDARLEHRQRHRAELEHGVVEGADIEPIAERLLGALASLDDGALAKVVGQRLPRPCDVAIHLGADLVLG